MTYQVFRPSADALFAGVVCITNVLLSGQWLPPDEPGGEGQLPGSGPAPPRSKARADRG